MKKRFLAGLTVLLIAVSFVCTAKEWKTTVYADSDAQEVAALTNRERAKKGRSLLRYSEQLSQAANVRAQEISEKFSHTRPDGSDNVTVMEELGLGYSYFGENIAFGPVSPEEVVGAWMDSPSHRTNILRGGFNCIGVGIAYSGGTCYWVQLFASSRSLAGTVITISGDVVSTTAASATTAPPTSAATTTATTAATSITSATSSATTATTSRVTTTTAASVTEPSSDKTEQEEKQGFWEKIIRFFKRLFGRE